MSSPASSAPVPAAASEGDEKEAILSLLQFSQPQVPVVPRGDSDEEQGETTRTMDTKTVEKRDIAEEEATSGTCTIGGPRNISPPPPPTLRSPPHEDGAARSPPLYSYEEQVFLKRMPKKRKDHPTVEGQFEDAPEVFSNNPPHPPLDSISVPKRLQHQHQHQHQSQYDAAAALMNQHRMAMLADHDLPPQLAATASLPFGGADQHQRERQFHLEAMLRAHMELQRLPPAPPGPAFPHYHNPKAAAETNALQMQMAHLQHQNNQHRLSPTFPNKPLQQQDEEDSSLPGNLLAGTASPQEDYAMRKLVEVPAMQPPRAKESDDSVEGKEGEASGRRFLSTRVRYEEYTPPNSWGALVNVPKMPHTPADDKLERPIQDINDSDVLLGRGGLTNTNPGNIKFRSLVGKHRMAYCTAPKGDKGALARFLCNFIRANKGRFLRKNDKEEASLGNWYEVGDDKAVMKCGQALREGTAELIRKTLNENNGSPHQIVDQDSESHEEQQQQQQFLEQQNK